MPDWVREHIGEIALLIYIFYPILKRWWDRRKQRGEQRPEPAQTEEASTPREPAPSRRERAHPRPPKERTKKRQARAAAKAARRTPRPSDGRTASGAKARARASEVRSRKQTERPTQADFLAAARKRLGRLQEETTRLVASAEREPRLARLLPALRDDLLSPLASVERSLAGAPTTSTIVHETTVLRGLEELFRHLSAIARQRTMGDRQSAAEAEAIADACYAPLFELARSRGLKLRTTQPVAVSSDWSAALVSKLAPTRVAPLRVPSGFDHDVFRWPAIAHEVAQDVYHSTEGLDEGLRARLNLPREVLVPSSEAEVDPAWLRRLFGPWLAEIFADTLGTLLLGPAYVEAMRRAFRNPGSPQRTAAIMQDGAAIDAHPPERLRLHMACRVLHHLGRHDEADASWERWETDHPDVGFYFLPLGGNWVGLSEESVHAVADSMVDVLLQRPWPELDDHSLLNVPGLAYLHAEHATVLGHVDRLTRGEPVDADARTVAAAAVLAAKAQPALHDTILAAARRSLRVTPEPLPAAAQPSRRRRTGSTKAELLASLRRPHAIREAVILGALWGQAPPRKPPYSR